MMKKTMKKALLLVLTLMLAILATGCMRADYAVDIKMNGDADLSYKITMDNEIYEAGYGDFMKQNYEGAGFTVNTETGDAETVLSITRTVPNGEDILLYTEGTSQLKFMTHESLFGKTYVLKEDLTATLASLSQMGVEDSRIALTVTLPVPPKYSNATATDNGGRTLIWNLDGTNGALELIATVPSIITLILALVVLALIIVLIVLVVRKRKPAAPAAEVAEEAMGANYLLDEEVDEELSEEEDGYIEEEAELPYEEEFTEEVIGEEPVITEDVFEVDETVETAEEEGSEE